MNFTDEQFGVVGNPTQLFVQEALGVVIDDNAEMHATVNDVAAVLAAAEGITDEEAHERIAAAVVTAEVDCRLDDEGRSSLMLPPLVFWRLWRRQWFWTLAEANVSLPPHFPNESAVVRAAIAEWNEGYGEPPSEPDLIDTVMELTGYGHSVDAIHVILNAVDAGAVRYETEYAGAATVRFFITEGWVQG